MGFGPFLSKEEKARINASMKRNGNGLIQGVGERITPEENERRRRAASPEGMGLTQKDLGVGFGPFVSPAQKIQINNNLRQSQGGPYGPGGAPDGSGRGQARQGVRPVTSQPRQSVRPATSQAPEAAIRSSMVSDSDYVVPKGQFRGPGQRQKSDGKGGWIDVNKVHASQPAVLGGKHVRADGVGNWLDSSGNILGTYKVGEDRTPKREAVTVSEKTKPPVEPTTKPPVETTTKPPTNNPERPVQPNGGQEVSALTGGRGDVRENANGVIQTGTNTSPKPMTMEDAGALLSSGYSFGDPYSSNQLPTTNSSPYKGMSSAQIYNQETLQQFDGDVDNVRLATDLFGGKSGVEAATPAFKMDKEYKAMDGYSKGQAPDTFDVGTPIGLAGKPAESGPTDWLNRSAADNSDEKVRRRSAMLDGNVGIMQAMRNQEAIQGRMYAGGKHYQVNKNKGQEGENDFVEISAGQARDRSWGNKSADEVFNNHLGKAKATASSSDSSDVPENTPAMLPDAVPHNTSMDKSPFDTSELLSGSQPFLNMESITDDDKPYVGMQKYNPFR